MTRREENWAIAVLWVAPLIAVGIILAYVHG